MEKDTTEVPADSSPGKFSKGTVNALVLAATNRFSGYVEYILYINKASSSKLILEGCSQEKVNDLRFLDAQKEEMYLLQGLDVHIPDQAAQFGDGEPLVLSLAWIGISTSKRPLSSPRKPVVTVVLPGPWQKDQSSQSSQGEMTHVKTVHTCVLEMKDLLNKPGIEPEKNGCEEEKPSRLLGLLREPEDETHLEAQPTDASAQFIISNLQISTEDLSKEPSISREDLISKEPNVIRSPRQPQNQNPKLPLSILKEKQLRNATLGSEETTEHAPSDASTTEGKLMELGHKIMKNLENTVKEIIKYLKSLFPPASEVVKP
ncbi:hypothetical protein MJG53_004678 [Ovis ammon polii x Ovis aries]|uniref:Uncharacterized protein n=1 Tax=Ovis ammon polii x Ovis aries TaxID=2918886 RepID=A0ACB9VAB5_9CETA|nr:hypothetical protein MJG53_004678 [Ovis ammon polii x Ovis aries]